MIRLGFSHCAKLIQVQTQPLTYAKTLQHALPIETTTPIFQSVRTSSFFTRLPAEKLWKSLITVSNPGKKKGRGKGLDQKRSIDLNRGQMIGQGKAAMYWPGLTGPVVKGSEIFSQRKMEKDPHFQENIIKLRETLGRKRREKLHPLERGWSGSFPLGRKFGPPDPIGDDMFENFESILLHTSYSSYMTYDLGRQRKIFIYVAVGNKNGLLGISKIKTKTFLKSGITKAKNRAVQRLMDIKRCNDRTIYHSFVGQFGHTKVFVTKKEEGYGLACHRIIKALCDLVGITDIHAKVEGANNVDHIIKAFLSGLIQQKTFQEIADDKKMHVVEIRKERNYYPQVLGYCKDPLTPEEAAKDPYDFNQYVDRNQVRLQKEHHPLRCANSNNFEKYLKRNDYKRNQREIKEQLKAEYGAIKSHLSALYPECHLTFESKHMKRRKEEAKANAAT